MRSDSITNTLRALGCVQTITDSFCTATKIISDRAAFHTKERLCWRGFSNEAKLRRAAPISKVESHISDRCHTIPYRFWRRHENLSIQYSVNIALTL